MAFAAVTLAIAFHGSTRHSKSRRQVMRYEDGLAKTFEAGSPTLELMAQAYIGGFSQRLPEWLESSERKNFRLPAKAFQKLFVALLSGDVATIETMLADADVQKLLAYQWPGMTAKLLSPEWLDLVLYMVIDPLILVGHTDLVPVIHANSLRRLGAGAQSLSQPLRRFPSRP
jgi:hypothetical protein